MDELEMFDAIGDIAIDWCITGPFKKVNNFKKSEPYIYGVIWNELYHLPFNQFLPKLLSRLGLNKDLGSINEIYIEPSFYINKYPGKPIKPDIYVNSKNANILFEYKNFSQNSGSFQEEQLAREFIAGIKSGPSKSTYLILITTENKSKVLIKKRGLKDPFEEVGFFSKKLLESEDESIKKSFVKNHKRENIVVISWKHFIDSIDEQLKESETNTSDSSLKELYSRTYKRIKYFIAERKEKYYK